MTNTQAIPLKICGITNHEDALACISHGVKLLGLIHVKSSPRYVDIKSATKLQQTITNNDSTPVLVLQEQDPEYIEQLAISSNIKHVQLHGSYSLDTLKKLTKNIFKIIVFHTSEYRCKKRIDSVLETIRPEVDRILIEDNAKDLTTVNHIYKAATDRNIKVLMAGNIGPDAISDIHEKFPLAGIDCCRSTEIHPGRKCANKVRSIATQTIMNCEANYE